MVEAYSAFIGIGYIRPISAPCLCSVCINFTGTTNLNYNSQISNIIYKFSWIHKFWIIEVCGAGRYDGEKFLR